LGATVMGRAFWPAIENVFPVILSWEISTALDVGLTRVKPELAAWPTVTVPNSTLVGAVRGNAVPDAFVTKLAPQPETATASKQLKTAKNALLAERLRRQVSLGLCALRRTSRDGLSNVDAPMFSHAWARGRQKMSSTCFTSANVQATKSHTEVQSGRRTSRSFCCT